MHMTFDGSPWGYESDLDVEISHITGSPSDHHGDNPVECEWAIDGWTREQHAAIPDDMVEKLDEATITYVIENWSDGYDDEF